jgi:hypothetical protein
MKDAETSRECSGYGEMRNAYKTVVEKYVRCRPLQAAVEKLNV